MFCFETREHEEECLSLDRQGGPTQPDGPRVGNVRPADKQRLVEIPAQVRKQKGPTGWRVGPRRHPTATSARLFRLQHPPRRTNPWHLSVLVVPENKSRQISRCTSGQW